MQCLTTLDGFVILLNMQHGLPYLDMHPYTDQEWEELLHVHLMQGDDWDPSVLDHEQSDDQEWYAQHPSTPLLFPCFMSKVSSIIVLRHTDLNLLNHMGSL